MKNTETGISVVAKAIEEGLKSGMSLLGNAIWKVLPT